MRSRATSVSAILGIVASLLLAGCTSGLPGVPSNSASPSATESASVSAGTPAPAPALGLLGAEGCAPASPTGFDAASGFIEVQGTSPAGTSLYGLIMSPFPLVASNTTSKFVWRITGSGEVTITVKRPDGSTGQLSWGPAAQDSRTYHRPGDEWGTGIILNAPGCWQLIFERDGVKSSVYLDVAPEVPLPTG